MNHTLDSGEQILYTVGYAGFSPEAFTAKLLANKIDAIVDVRALPHISHFECYKRDNIREILRSAGIQYKYFGKIFGARSDSPDLFTDGKVDFEKIRANSEFQKTCHNLKTGMDKNLSICLMCAQIDPLICHRAILITDFFRYLYPQVKILHILPDRIESQEALDLRVLALYRKKQYASSLFPPQNRDERSELKKAYVAQGQEIAYSPL